MTAVQPGRGGDRLDGAHRGRPRWIRAHPTTCLAAVTLALAGCSGDTGLPTSVAGAGTTVAAARQPTVSGPSAAEPTVAATPRTPLPPGWSAYRSRRPVFAVAVPPGWAVDESSATVGEVAFSSGASRVVVSARPAPDPRITPALLRDRLVNYTTRSCETGRTISHRGAAQVAGMTFLTARARCMGEEAEEQKYERAEAMLFYVGVARKGPVQWSFQVRHHEDDARADEASIITPFLKSLDIR